MHGAVLNSAALKKWNITADTNAARRGNRAQAGHERALRPDHGNSIPADLASLPQPTRDRRSSGRAGQMLYAAAGITTAHEGATHAADLALMQRAAQPTPTSST